MKFILFSLLLLNALSQTHSIVGKVIDKKSNTALEFANVYIENTSFGSATDMDGNFEIRKLPAGKHKVLVTFSGYISEIAYLETSDEYPHISHTFYMEENIFEADLVLVEADLIIEVNPISMLQLKRKYSIYPPKKIAMRNLQIKNNLDIYKLNLYDLNQSNWFDENLNYILIGVTVVATTIFLTQ